MTLGGSLAAVRGWPHPEYEATYLRAREVAERIGDAPDASRRGRLPPMEGRVPAAAALTPELLFIARWCGS
jgi:hypothetical protein